MDIVERLREEATSDCVAYTEFMLQYKKTEDALYCFFEGFEDPIYYTIRIESISYKTVVDFVCGGKDDVIKVHNLIKESPHYKNVKTGFFIDSDFDNYNLPETIYKTPTYSIENLYCVQEAFEKILLAEFKMKRTDDDFVKCIENYKTLQQKFTSEMLLFNAWLACQSDIRNDLKTKTRLNIDNKVKAKFDKVVLPDLTGIKPLEGLTSKQEIQSIYNNSPSVSDDALNIKSQEFAYINQSEKFRGKFLIRFLESYLCRLQSIFGTTCSPFVNKYSCNLRIENATMCSSLSQYAKTPECLKRYIIETLR
ncbi:DUF4435 domain-containing protein [Pedobacter sp. HMF7647]|uniref:DUF4435 domain-containing protein n=1 Tax=Hufsiella arboris TaxID=2695275 RepID=A0A7K1YAZ5_9SPHI|nr:DUF4435 domain-containing protein [Hufsiella arboris]MXV51228.1 DUF4435 domain-containing protein [Hufsiella arboris]